MLYAQLCNLSLRNPELRILELRNKTASQSGYLSNEPRITFIASKQHLIIVIQHYFTLQARKALYLENFL